MRDRGILSLLLLLALPGCTTAWAISGTSFDHSETVSGAVTRYMDGGTLEIYGSGGTHCTGTFVNRAPGEGLGRLLCDDRRSGPFAIDMLKKRGEAHIADRAFAFTLGSMKSGKR